MRATRIYVAGPMTGLPDYNYPAFNEAEAYIKGLGYETENPASAPDVVNGFPYQGAPYEWYLRRAVRQVLDCDMLVYLPGSENSKGAQLEMTIARALAMPIISLEEFTKHHDLFINKVAKGEPSNG